MSNVFSMESEGIWNACTAKVMAKTAITTVAMRDCIGATQPASRSREGGLGRGSSGWGFGSTLGSTRMGSVLDTDTRSEEHTSELQSQSNLVCRLLLEKKKKKKKKTK